MQRGEGGCQLSEQLNINNWCDDTDNCACGGCICLHLMKPAELPRRCMPLSVGSPPAQLPSCNIILPVNGTGFAVHMQTHQDWLAEQGLAPLAKRVDASVI